MNALYHCERCDIPSGQFDAGCDYAAECHVDGVTVLDHVGNSHTVDRAWSVQSSFAPINVQIGTLDGLPAFARLRPVKLDNNYDA